MNNLNRVKIPNGIDFARDIVFEIDKKIKRVFWTNEQIEKWFGKRSAKEIFENGTTCFMNPCLDVTLTSASIMYIKRVPYTLIIEEHLPTKNFNFNRLHFAINYEYNKKLYSLNYKTCNEVYISKEHYEGRKDIQNAQVLGIPGEKISPNQPIYKSLGYSNIGEMIKNKFKGYSLEKNLSRLKRDNSKEKYELFKKIHGEKFIIIEQQNQPLT